MEPINEDEADRIVEIAAEHGIKIPKTYNALKYALAKCHNDLLDADLTASEDDEDRGEFMANTCRDGCCINLTVVPDEVTHMGAFISKVLMNPEAALEFIRANSWQLHLTGMD